MSKCSKLKRSLWRIKPMKRVFWSFEFLSFGIVSNLVLRYSNFQRSSSCLQFYWWSPIISVKLDNIYQ